MGCLAVVCFLVSLWCFFAGLIGPGIAFLLLAWMCALCAG